MTPGSLPQLYRGDGTLPQDASVPLFRPIGKLDDPRYYVADRGLRDAVNVALQLGQPLLLTGEPGTGKTQLAGSVAHEFGLRLLAFNSKTTSTARDLFYRYDALRHFHDSQVGRGEVSPESYITYEALGLATLLSLAPDEIADLAVRLPARGPTRSVVLIDEIDKAPRDFPNDILHEIERMAFAVHETGREFRSQPSHRPIVVLTSNSEKDLPDPFLRRCVFYHIEFPGPARLKDIVRRRLELDSTMTPQMLDNAVSEFERIRALGGLRKRPATAEFLAWVYLLGRHGIDAKAPRPEQKEVLLSTYAVLVKSKEDRDLIVGHAPGGGE